MKKISLLLAFVMGFAMVSACGGEEDFYDESGVESNVDSERVATGGSCNQSSCESGCAFYWNHGLSCYCTYGTKGGYGYWYKIVKGGRRLACKYKL